LSPRSLEDSRPFCKSAERANACQTTRRRALGLAMWFARFASASGVSHLRMAHAKAKVGIGVRCMPCLSDHLRVLCACPALHCMSGCHWCHHVREYAPERACKLVVSDTQLLIQFQGIRALHPESGANINANPCSLLFFVSWSCQNQTLHVVYIFVDDFFLSGYLAGEGRTLFFNPFDLDAAQSSLCSFSTRIPFPVGIGPVCRLPSDLFAFSFGRTCSDPRTCSADAGHLCAQDRFEHVTPGESAEIESTVPHVHVKTRLQ